MSPDFILKSRKRKTQKVYTAKKVRKPATIMSGALPSSSAAKNATLSRKDANIPNDGEDIDSATPPSAQRPPASKSSPIDADDGDAVEEVSQPVKKAVPAERNAFTVLASSQAAKTPRSTPAGRPAAQKWTSEEEWTVAEGIREGLSQAQILLNLLPSERSASAVRGKKRELQEKFGDKLERLANMPNSTPRVPAPPMPPRKAWSPSELTTLRKCMTLGISDRDIQALHFPNRTEDSVIGRLRKVRAVSAKRAQRRSGGGIHTPHASQTQYHSSSPAMFPLSSQTRSSPAQAAAKRQLEEGTTEKLPVVQEEESVLQDVDDVDDSEEPEIAVGDANDDMDDSEEPEIVVEDVLNTKDMADSEEPEISVDDANDGTDQSEEPEIVVQDAINTEDVQVTDVDCEEVIIPDSPVSYPKASTQTKPLRTAYVVIPARPDLSDVLDFRAGPLVRRRAAVNDQEARYAATTPPFGSGQEKDRVGMMHSTKLSIWREAYSYSQGDAEAAYRMYASLTTDEHMLQAVCNLDHEIINGIKAVRMRRAREDALREGRPPPVTPVRDQPQHLDLFEKKVYGRYWSYHSWEKEVKDMYLREPVVFGPRPVPGEPIDYFDPMQEAMYDDGDDGDDGDDPYDERLRPAEPFHGHVSEIDEEEEAPLKKRKEIDEAMPPPPAKKQKKEREWRQRHYQKMQQKKQKQPPKEDGKKIKPGSKPTPVIGKKGQKKSQAALRRRRLSLRRPDASTSSKAASDLSKDVQTVEPGRTSAVPDDLDDGDESYQWMRDIVKNAQHRPPPVRRKSPPPIDPNNLFGCGDPSDSSSSDSDND
ncbi:uncharacterized protein RCC_03735 [Ramularia collo-cygni]|uniref:Uncharacterized protein n=1 Tax=Ramularia collo-cygni TaxID=112498 RepID=A0A2D3USR8_9PEZI|nr:uncharacterized protein RCC_03735 [Ramularia collo-cygni]CZT17898.1 uncharacterized protein RCC_03735 [Ramularia collo-cygni]